MSISPQRKLKWLRNQILLNGCDASPLRCPPQNVTNPCKNASHQWRVSVIRRNMPDVVYIQYAGVFNTAHEWHILLYGDSEDSFASMVSLRGHRNTHGTEEQQVCTLTGISFMWRGGKRETVWQRRELRACVRLTGMKQHWITWHLFCGTRAY